MEIRRKDVGKYKLCPICGEKCKTSRKRKEHLYEKHPGEDYKKAYALLMKAIDKHDSADEASVINRIYNEPTRQPIDFIARVVVEIPTFGFGKL